MRGTSHQASSLLLASWMAFEFHPTLQVGLAFSGGLVLAARGPDQLEFKQMLDRVRRRKIARLARRLGKPPAEVTEVEKVQAGIMRWHIRHRGPTHWLVPTGVLVALLAGLLAGLFVETREVAPFFAFGVLAGYWLHPLLDLLNRRPVQLLPGVWVGPVLPEWTFSRHWPLIGGRRVSLRVESCGAVDTVLCALMLVATVYFVLRLAPQDWEATAGVGR